MRPPAGSGPRIGATRASPLDDTRTASMRRRVRVKSGGGRVERDLLLQNSERRSAGSGGIEECKWVGDAWTAGPCRNRSVIKRTQNKSSSNASASRRPWFTAIVAARYRAGSIVFFYGSERSSPCRGYSRLGWYHARRALATSGAEIPMFISHRPVVLARGRRGFSNRRSLALARRARRIRSSVRPSVIGYKPNANMSTGTTATGRWFPTDVSPQS